MLRTVMGRRSRLAPDPIIIFGAPRSGTSYLNRLVNQHPDIYVSEEARLFGWVHQSLKVLAEDRNLIRKHQELFVDHLRARYPELIRGFYRDLRPKASYWGDKNPHYASAEQEGCLETITELFPGTRFIHIIRDGRDVVTSVVRKGWADFERAHEVWTAHVDIGSKFAARFPDSCLEIRYEDLVSDDVAGARKIFEFLGIPIHRSVVRFCRKQQRRRSLVKKPTRDIRLGIGASDWGRLFSPDQKLRSMELIGDHLVRFGYETDSSLSDAKKKLSQQSGFIPPNPIREVIRRTVPEDATIIVMSDGDEELIPAMDGRRVLLFPQQEGGDNIPIGLDAIDPDAESGLRTLQASGGNYLLVPSSGYQWLNRRKDFLRHVDANFRRIWADDHCLIYELIGDERESTKEARSHAGSSQGHPKSAGTDGTPPAEQVPPSSER
jgi:Sulfotransferase family